MHLFELTEIDRPTRRVVHSETRCPYCHARTYTVHELGLPDRIARHFTPEKSDCYQSWNPGTKEAQS